jgi:hypothetical protein
MISQVGSLLVPLAADLGAARSQMAFTLGFLHIYGRKARR